MPFLIGAAVILFLMISRLYRYLYARRANAKFQRSIWVYDEARRRRILAGEDPKSIPTAEENLVLMGFGSQVRNIERLPRPDPVVDRPVSTPTLKPTPSVPVVLPSLIAAIEISQPSPQTPLRLAPSPTPPQPLPDHRLVSPSSAPSLPTARTTGPSLQYEMTYATEWGEVTERRIRLKRVYSEHGEVYVEAHCYLRRERRTFRADRMSDLVEVDTDMPIADPVEHFLGFIEPEEIVTPGHELVMAKARPGLFAMVWIGRAGGDLDPETIEILSAFCADRARMNRGATDFNAKLAERWIADQRPTFEIASGSLARMKRGGPEWQMVHERARQLAELRDVDKRTKRLARLFKA